MHATSASAYKMNPTDWNLTEDVYKAAERDLRDAFEAYTGLDPSDAHTIVRRTEDEVVEWLAKQYAFSLYVGTGRQGFDGLTSKDAAMWFLASNLKSTIRERIMQCPAHVQARVGQRVRELPPPPTIGPMRADRRNERKERRQTFAAQKCTASVHDAKQQSFDYYVPPSQEEREAAQRRQQLAQASRAQRHHLEKPYSETGPSHRSTPKEKRELSASEAIERLQWKEERPIRKEDAEAKQAAARRAAHERARKKAQKQRKKRALLALADEYEQPAECAELTIADFVAN